MNIGKDKGHSTYQELNENLSDASISSEEIKELKGCSDKAQRKKFMMQSAKHNKPYSR
jgi:hypothetical protein